MQIQKQHQKYIGIAIGVIVLLVGGFFTWNYYKNFEAQKRKQKVQPILDYVKKNLVLQVGQEVSTGAFQFSITAPSLDIKNIDKTIAELESEISDVEMRTTEIWDNTSVERDDIVYALRQMLEDIQSIDNQYNLASYVPVENVQADKSTEHYQIRMGLSKLKHFQQTHKASYENVAGAIEEMLYFLEESEAQTIDAPRGQLLLSQLQDATNTLFESAQGLKNCMYSFENKYNKYREDEFTWNGKELNHFYVNLQDIIYDKILIQQADKVLKYKKASFEENIDAIANFLGQIESELITIQENKQRFQNRLDKFSKQKNEILALFKKHGISLRKDVSIDVKNKSGQIQVSKPALSSGFTPIKQWDLNATAKQKGTQLLDVYINATFYHLTEGEIAGQTLISKEIKVQ
ncbi:hypothetical protein V6R21_15320 [Limibacter armeniacum]|uniref:hypothetical protein n=1 Tax=Limibacter armeniacum TaxID=466084 RepID=UPI002FE5AF07